MHANTFKPSDAADFTLPQRETPARLLAVSTAQLVALHDAAGVSDGVSDPGTALGLPAAGQDAVLQLGPDCLAVVRGGVFEVAHYWGTLAPVSYAGDYAEAEGLPLFELTLDPALDGKLPADAAFVAALLENVPGQTTFLAADLESGLGVNPVTLAAEGFTTDPDTGELVGNGVLTLQLATEVEGGWQLFTLTSGLDEYGLHSAWELAGSAFAATEPGADWLRLTVRE